MGDIHHGFTCGQILSFGVVALADKRSRDIVGVPFQSESVRNYGLSIMVDAEPAGLSRNERQLMEHFAAEERVTITAADVVALREVSRGTAHRILSRLAEKGWLVRVKRGVYSPTPLGAGGSAKAASEPWVLAMELFAPCYISGWSAAGHWDLTEQIFNATAVVTAKAQRAAEQDHGGVSFRVRTMPEEKLFGTRRVWLGSRRVEVADPSRLLVDCLADPLLGGGGRHVIDVVRAYWRSEHADPELLLRHATQFGVGSVFKRLGFLTERFGAAPDFWLDACMAQLTRGISDLDPAGPKRGSIVSRWNLRVNLPVGDE